MSTLQVITDGAMGVEPDGKRPAAIYLRRSTDKQEQSIPDQRREVTRYADEHGFSIVAEFVDDAETDAAEHDQGNDGQVDDDVAPVRGKVGREDRETGVAERGNRVEERVVGGLERARRSPDPAEEEHDKPQGLGQQGKEQDVA